MKSLELTTEHKTILLEMCFKLFPDNFIDEDCHITSGNNILFFNKKDENTYTVKEIHWFEFVMTHLVEKLFNPFPDRPSRGISDKFKEFYWNVNLYWWELSQGQIPVNPHPIDVLFKEYQNTTC